MPTEKLADNIKDVSDTIITQALICPETGWRFNIAQNELSFYKKTIFLFHDIILMCVPEMP